MKIEIKGAKEFSYQIRKNPEVVKKETADFFNKSIIEFKRVVNISPWRLGGNGGGAPVDTGNLRESHKTDIRAFTATYGVNTRRADYAWAVHEGTARMKERPWLNYAIDQKKGVIDKLANEMLKKVVVNLAK